MTTDIDSISPAGAQEIEAAAEGYVVAPMTGYDGTAEDLRVLPSTRWRASAIRALNAGDIDGFMRKVLHEDDYASYERLDPDTEAVGQFAEAVGDASGEALGKSSGPRASSRSTRKR